MITKCPHCQKFHTVTEEVVDTIRVRSYVLSPEDWASLSSMLQAQQNEVIKGMFKDQQVYTHVDVYSPNEDLLYRVKL